MQALLWARKAQPLLSRLPSDEAGQLPEQQEAPEQQQQEQQQKEEQEQQPEAQAEAESGAQPAEGKESEQQAEAAVEGVKQQLFDAVEASAEGRQEGSRAAGQLADEANQQQQQQQQQGASPAAPQPCTVPFEMRPRLSGVLCRLRPSINISQMDHLLIIMHAPHSAANPPR
jgi:hypothetical protein